jgi:hypothetical protein
MMARAHASIHGLAAIFAAWQSRLVGLLQQWIEARKRKAAHDRAFYRNLRAYCAAHNVPVVCEDDWRTSRQ